MHNLHAKNNLACIILTGGLSSRMESHKALLPFSLHQNFLQHIIEVYQQAGLKEIIVVKNKEIDFAGLESEINGISTVNNCFPEKGRLYSIQLGLLAAPDAGFCFIQNIDTPFVTTKIIHQLAEHKACADYISPEFNGKGGHPVLLSASILKTIAGLIDYTQTLRDVLAGFSRYKIPTTDEQCTLNINTKEDYEQYFSGYKTHRA